MSSIFAVEYTDAKNDTYSTITDKLHIIIQYERNILDNFHLKNAIH